MIIEVKICGANPKEKLSYRCNNTITITAEQVLEHWESIADVPLICCIPIPRT